MRTADFHGRSIGPLRLARAMVVNIVAGSSVMMAITVLWPTAPITLVFLREHLHASNALIGLNVTLVLLASAAALPGAWLFSRIQRRRPLWIVVTAAARAIMFGPAVIALLSNDPAWRTAFAWLFVLGLFGVQLGGVFTSPGWWSWMADLIPESIRGVFFGRRYKWMLLTQSAAGLAAAVLLDRAGRGATAASMFFVVFFVAAMLAVADPLMFLRVPEPFRERPSRRSFREMVNEYVLPLRDRAFRRMLIGAATYGFFFNLPDVFRALFLRGEDVGGVWIGGQASLRLLAILGVVSGVATMLAADLWGRLADRIGHRTVWVLGSLGYFVHLLLFFVNKDNYVWISLAHAFAFGVLFAGQPVAVQNMALSMAPPKKHEFYMSMFSTVTAMSAAAAPALGGWLADEFKILSSVHLPSGQPLSYFHLLLLIAFAGVLLTLPLMVRVPDPKGTSVLPWFSRLLSGDLARTAWNIGVLATPSSPARRVRALRRVQHRDGNIVLPEIMAALDDADTAVRREALLALGRVGTPEALDLLRWYLHEPDALLRAPSVEALARAGVPDRASLLKRALRDPDSRVRRAAADALGASGERNAVEDLRSLLDVEHDGEVLVSAALALSRLKEFGAIRQMTDLALHAGNSTVRSQMLIALADLLGGVGDFPQLWRRDRHLRGSGFAQLARKLGKQARVLARTDHGPVPRSRARRKVLVGGVDREVETFLEHVQNEAWTDALGSLKELAVAFLQLRYRYRGDAEHALEFASAVAPQQAERYWLITYLHAVAQQRDATEAQWDGLVLLATYVLVHGQPPP